MTATSRLAAATSIVLLIGSGLYACSSTDSTGIPNTPAGGDSGAHPATPNGGEAGTPPPGDDASIVDPPDTSTPPPTTCAVLESGASNLPVLAPAACKTCAAEKCCAQLTTCYGAKPADAGLDGSNGSKTNCQLFGECEAACNGNVGCEDACAATYGETPAGDWLAADTCLAGPAPGGCQDFCN